MITDYISEDKRFQELDDVFGQDNILVTGLSPSAKATIIAEKYLKDHKQLLLVTNNLYQADKIEADLYNTLMVLKCISTQYKIL